MIAVAVLDKYIIDRMYLCLNVARSGVRPVFHDSCMFVSFAVLSVSGAGTFCGN